MEPNINQDQPINSGYQNAPITPNPDPKAKQQKNFLWVMAGVVGLLFTIVVALIIIGVNLIVSSTRSAPPPVPIAPKEEPVVPKPIKASRFATDSGVLKIREDLQKLRSDIDSVDLFETQLSPPNIDLGINIPVIN